MKRECLRVLWPFDHTVSESRHLGYRTTEASLMAARGFVDVADRRSRDMRLSGGQALSEKSREARSSINWGREPMKLVAEAVKHEADLAKGAEQKESRSQIA